MNRRYKLKICYAIIAALILLVGLLYYRVWELCEAYVNDDILVLKIQEGPRGGKYVILPHGGKYYLKRK